jgi:hypothetical protein
LKEGRILDIEGRKIKEGRKEGRKEGKKEGRKEGRKIVRTCQGRRGPPR